MKNAPEIPPPPPLPSFPGNGGRVWFYATPLVLDLTVLLCTTLLVALRVLDVEWFKWLAGGLAIGNVALRLPGKIPGGGGLVAALIATITRRAPWA